MNKSKTKQVTYRHFDVSRDGRGVVRVVLNVQDRSTNVITESVMEELDAIVSDLETCDVKSTPLVVFESGKESGFLMGADVEQIASLDCPQQIHHVIEAGQLLFQRIEWLPMPTLAVIEGPCLGGGLEWALACRFRIARDSESTKLGLPEIKLGLIPGWGGTQRLPRLVTLLNALPMILQGKLLRPATAKKIGLIDQAIVPERWESGVQHMVDQVIRNPDLRCPTLVQRIKRRIIDGRLSRAILLRRAERAIASNTQHYPALSSAIVAMRASSLGGFLGYQTERTEFKKLLSTPTCRSLLELFLSRSKAQRLATWMPASTEGGRELPDAHDLHRPIQRVGVVGGGVMGAGIAQWAATRGFHVTVKELDQAAAATAQTRMEASIESLAQRQHWTRQRVSEVKERLNVSSDIQSLGEADIVIEAIAERVDWKQHAFEQVESVVSKDAMIVTNTSSLSVDTLAESLRDSRRFAGLHFFNPVHRMELVEVVCGSQTDRVLMGKLIGFVRSLGKVPIVTTDSPGFLVNRVLFPYLGEAMRMVAGGKTPEAIDREAEQFGMPMGPIELLDQVGLDVALHVSGSLRSVMDDDPKIAAILSQKVEQGELGKKSGKGFYAYDKKGKIVTKSARGGDSFGDRADSMDAMTPIQQRLIYPMLIESQKCFDEHVVDFAWAIDLAMVLGTGFAPHRGGPMRMIDQIGLSAIRNRCDALAMEFGPRFLFPNSPLDVLVQGDVR